MIHKGKDIPSGLFNLLNRLKTYSVDWKFTFVPTENTEYEVGTDREAASLDDANVVSSEFKPETFLAKRHVVAIDLDVPAYLIPSSTVGHSHLYIDVPNGIAWEDYSALLDALAKCGVIENGYREVSQKRGHTDLRLPWVSKADQKLATVEEMSARASEARPVVLPDLDEFDPLPFDAVVDPF